MATIEDFLKLEFKTGTVIEALELEGSEKLLKLTVDLGPLPIPEEEINATSAQEIEKEVGESSNTSEQTTPETGRDIRTILSGIKQWYKPEDIKGKQFVFITNLEPLKMMGIESQGMILAADGDKPIPLVPSEAVPDGTKIR